MNTSDLLQSSFYNVYFHGQNRTIICQYLTDVPNFPYPYDLWAPKSVHYSRALANFHCSLVIPALDLGRNLNEIFDAISLNGAQIEHLHVMRQDARPVGRRVQLRAGKFIALKTKVDLLADDAGIGCTLAADDRAVPLVGTAPGTGQFIARYAFRQQVLQQFLIILAHVQFTCSTINTTGRNQIDP